MSVNTFRIGSPRQFLAVAFGAVFAVTVLTVISMGSASAQEAGNTDAGTANTLKISPVRTDVTVDPGKTKIVKVTVTNPSSEKVTVRVIQNDLVADKNKEDGTPAIYLDETEYAESHSLKRFMTPVENVTLEGKESKVVNVELKIPANAEPGGYFGVVRFAPANPDEGGQVNVSASLASLILLTVSGDAPEKLDLTEFAIKQNNRTKSFFVNSDNVVVTARFQNTGAVQAGPFGKILVTKGDDVVYETDFNNKDQRDMVLPDSARRWTIPVDDISAFGKYTVNATFTYGSENKTIDVSESFWVIPRNVIIAAIAGLILLVGAIVAGVMYFRRRRNSFGGSFSHSTRRR